MLNTDEIQATWIYMPVISGTWEGQALQASFDFHWTPLDLCVKLGCLTILKIARDIWNF